uniref:Uncharacterized protein n=1 Tax=Rhizophora mucronata TaxID=61149 RepID=A0A2P2Q947_RHIMU
MFLFAGQWQEFPGHLWVSFFLIFSWCLPYCFFYSILSKLPQGKQWWHIFM